MELRCRATGTRPRGEVPKPWAGWSGTVAMARASKAKNGGDGDVPVRAGLHGQRVTCYGTIVPSEPVRSPSLRV